MNRIRKLFNKEIFYRLFIVLQVVGILCIIYMDVSLGRDWNFFPDFFALIYMDYTGNWQFDLRYWLTIDSGDAFFFLVAPFAISKAIDWVVASKYS